jgi:hypothetical protein
MKYSLGSNEIFPQAAMKYQKHRPRQPMKYSLGSNEIFPQVAMKY